MFLVALIAIMLVTLFVFAIRQSKKQKEILKNNPGYPEGYWLNRGMGIGIAIGMGLGVALQNIPIGAGVGIALGVAMGKRKELKHKDKMRPLTDEEKKLRKQSIMFSMLTLVVGALVFVAFYFITR